MGGATLFVTQWDGDDKVEGVDATNTESGGYQEMAPGGGIASMNGSVAALLIDGAPPAFTPGQIVAFELYEGNKTSGYQYSGNAYVENFKRANVVKATDPIGFTFDYKSSLVFVRPTS